MPSGWQSRMFSASPSRTPSRSERRTWVRHQGLTAGFGRRTGLEALSRLLAGGVPDRSAPPSSWHGDRDDAELPGSDWAYADGQRHAESPN